MSGKIGDGEYEFEKLLYEKGIPHEWLSRDSVHSDHDFLVEVKTEVPYTMALVDVKSRNEDSLRWSVPVHQTHHTHYFAFWDKYEQVWVGWSTATEIRDTWTVYYGDKGPYYVGDPIHLSPTLEGLI